MEQQSEKQHTGLQWLEEYNEQLKEIKEISPFLLTLGISVGIEFIGKLLSKDEIDSSDKCKDKFEKALSEFTSLNKYHNKDLYNLVRCGLVHHIGVKDGIILSTSTKTDLESATKRLNVDNFYNDFSQAVEEAQNKTDWPNPFATSAYIAVNNISETGTTKTFINQYQ